MKVAVFGLGYVGAVSAACLAKLGHDVWGVDIDGRKLEALRQGRAPFFEPGLDDLLVQVHQEGRLHATSSAAEAIGATDLCLLCVGTPSAPNGKVEVGHLIRASEEIAAALAQQGKPYSVVYRSTVFPAVLEQEVIPRLAEAGGDAFARMLIGVNPEFLREGSAVRDFFDPPYILIGTTAPRLVDQLRLLYRGMEAPIIVTSVPIAGLVKYANNAFHALKVAFANEMGQTARALGADGYELMEVFCRDEKLNLSRYYLKPGFAFGGSCLPKDLRALLHEARRRDIELPLARAIAESNDLLITSTGDRILAIGKRHIGVLGLAHKAYTDDVRESPVVSLIERLVGKGCEVKIFDPHLTLDSIYGTNRAFLDATLPHVSRLMAVSAREVVAHAEILIVTQPLGLFGLTMSDVLDNGRLVFDFVRNAERGSNPAPGYEGIAW